MLIIAVGYDNIISIERQRMLVNNGMSEWQKALSVVSNFFQKWKGDGKKIANKEWRECNLIEKILEHTFFDEPYGFITKKANSIWKFPDDSSGEWTRHVPIDKKQDGPS